MTASLEEVEARLNLETGQIAWRDLQRYFAGGRLLVLDDALDLVKTAALFAEDQAGEVETLLKANRLVPASTAQARRWQETDAVFWAVVVAPWVLVQEINPATA